jgi:uncharacterized protein YdhG (YjbR/CyaY superfamily)
VALKRAAAPSAAKTTVAGYLVGAPKDKRETLRMFRSAIRAAAPTATERIAYGGLVQYKYKGKVLIYFGYASAHCALYGGWVQAYADELKRFVASKGTTPKNPISAGLVTKIVRARMSDIDRKS